MPPLYDDINDALLLSNDGQHHTVNVDTTGATEETNENTYGSGFPGVWLKIDLSNAGYYGLNTEWTTHGDGYVNVPFEFDLLKTGGDAGFAPWIEFYAVNDASFDPSSPDFSKLYYISFSGIGDGTSDPAVVTRYYRPDATASGSGGGSVTGIYYVHCLDWNYTYEGQFDIAYMVGLPDYIPSADTSGSGTVTTSGDAVRDSQELGDDWFLYWEGPDDRNDSFYVRGAGMPPPGTWNVHAIIKNAGASGAHTARVLVAVNGTPMPSATAFSDTLASRIRITLTGNHYGASKWDVSEPGSKIYPIAKPLTIPIGSTGDEIAFRFFNSVFGSNVAEIRRVKFVPVSESAAALSGDYVTGNDLPLGASADGDSISTSPRQLDTHDLCECAGSVYVFYSETNGSDKYLTVKEWDGASWNTISTDIWGHGAPSATRKTGSLACCSDGTDVYFAWAETDGTTAGGMDNWHWRCKKYDVSGASFSELGSGQRRYAPAGSIPAEVGSDFGGTGGNGFLMKHHPSSGLWISMGERDTSRTNYGDWGIGYTRASLWNWNGSSWDQVHPDDPSDLAGGSDYTVDFFANERQRHVGFTFCHYDGPSQYPSCFYIASSDGDDPHQIVYQEYNGSTWGNEILLLPIGITGVASGDFNPFNSTDTENFGAGSRCGAILVDDGSSPHLVFYLERSGEDLSIIASVDTDGAGMTKKAYISEISAGNFLGGIDAAFRGTLLHIARWDDDDVGGAHVLLTQQETGTGDAMSIAAADGTSSVLNYSTAHPRLAVAGETIWMSATDSDILGVWRWDGVSRFTPHIYRLVMG